MELIPLQPEHCEAVAAIAKDSLPEHWSLEGIQDVLRYDSNIYYVARCQSDGNIAGFAGIMIIADEAELLNIAVQEEYRKKGIGGRLLEKMITEAGRHGARRLLLEVRISNERAISLYRNRGFVKLGERKDYYRAPTEDALVMECSLLQQENNPL
ncbi:MAG: ribosomal protein S18-alanine N-acetyltransferase [Lachnospiraceae bacterium]|nr:ribosomal protein S18-alanine N-acetyltransferase [Lachnospiraceae bacterium]